jgi:hypothetical protein
MVRFSLGELRVRIRADEVRERLRACFDPDGADASERVGRAEVISIGREWFCLRHRAPRAAVQYLVRGTIADQNDGSTIALERRLRGGMIGLALVVALTVGISIALFTVLLWIGRGGLTEWMGLMMLPWVLVTLGGAVLGRISQARTEIADLEARLREVFSDVLVHGEEGPYR